MQPFGDAGLTERPLSRRQFLARSAALGGAALVAGPLGAFGGSVGSASDKRRQRPGVVVVGAGLAGLTCAYRLHQHGVAASVYEARPDRVGGRCWTAREFADGQVVARLDPESSVRRGKEVDLWVDTTKLHFFHPEGGRNLILDADQATNSA